MDFSTQVFDMFEQFRKMPGLNGGKLLRNLSSFMDGYMCAYSHLTGRPFYFRWRFQRFIEERYPPWDKDHHAYSWETILLHYYPGEAAYDAFYQELEAFKIAVGVGANSLLYTNESAP